MDHPNPFYSLFQASLFVNTMYLGFFQSQFPTLTASLPWFTFFQAAFWVALYGSRLLSPVCRSLPLADQAYWATSVVSSLHGIGISYLALCALNEAGMWDSTDFHLTTPATYRCCHIFLGYVSADLLPLWHFRRQWNGTAAYFVHHAICLTAWGMCASEGVCCF